jgi:hypothetical protein
MTIIVGDTRMITLVRELQERGWGRMWIDRKPTPYPKEPWGFDNGAYRDWRAGRGFDQTSFERRLERALEVPAPYLAVVPDIVGGGVSSLKFSNEWVRRLPPKWPWYLAVQDGMAVDDVESSLGLYSGIFLGGTNSFKATAPEWGALAKRRGLPFHYGRAGIPSRILHARFSGADSLDSAGPLWEKKRWRWFTYVIEHGHPQTDLFRSP